ncbi:MAG: Abi family protein [Clostridiales bacterium]|nr:Abi family protein [Clostridiales bacterium]
MKEFFTYEQQIEKLKNSYGLIIDDEDRAINDLKWEGYYNIINGYSSIFKDKDKYIPNTTFENIKHLYNFDKQLRGIVYKYTTSIECHVKALIAHEFSRVHGVNEKDYLDISCFNPAENSKSAINRLIDECNKTIQDALNPNSNKYRQYIDHNYKSHGHVPLWVLIRALSFGTVSIFYKNMRKEERSAVANIYKIPESTLSNMLEVVVSFRNIVAHGERTFCAKLPKTRLTTNLTITNKLNLNKNGKGENMYGRKDFLSLLICFKYLLPASEFIAFFTEFQTAVDVLQKNQKINSFKKIMTNMGLRSDSWKNLPKLTF